MHEYIGREETSRKMFHTKVILDETFLLLVNIT